MDPWVAARSDMKHKSGSSPWALPGGSPNHPLLQDQLFSMSCSRAVHQASTGMVWGPAPLSSACAFRCAKPGSANSSTQDENAERQCSRQTLQGWAKLLANETQNIVRSNSGKEANMLWKDHLERVSKEMPKVLRTNRNNSRSTYNRKQRNFTCSVVLEHR